MTAESVGRPLDERWQRVLQGARSGAALRLGSLLVGFVATPLLLSKIGVIQFGLLAALTAVSTLLTATDFGLGVGVVSRLVDAWAVGDEGDAARTATTSIWLMSGLGCTVGIIGAGAVSLLPIPQLLSAPTALAGQVTTAAALVALGAGAGFVGALPARLMQARQLPALAASLTTLATVTASLGVLGAAWLGAPFSALVAIQVFAPTVISLGMFPWTLSRCRIVLAAIDRPQATSEARLLLRRGRLFAFLQATSIVNYQVDALVLANILGAPAAAIYATGSRLWGIAIMILALTTTPLFAAFADAAALNDTEWIKRRFQVATKLNALLGVGMAGVLLIGAPSFIDVWTSGRIQTPLLLIGAAAAWIVVFAINQPQAMLLNALRVERLQITTALCTVLANLILSVWLTLTIGISGPLWGSVIAQVIGTLIPSSLYLRRRLRGDPE